MILQKLNLKNTFCHLNSEITFKEGINLILGENGSGKSSLIESIYLALYNDSFKAKRITETCYYGQSTAIITLITDLFKIQRIYRKTPTDYLLLNNGKKISGREATIKYIENNIAPKKFFQHIIYTAQGKLLDIVEMTAGERNEFLNYILSLDYITAFGKLLTKTYNLLNTKKSEIYLILKKIESSRLEQKKELIQSLEETEKRLKEARGNLEKLEREKEKLDLKKKYVYKKDLLNEYAKLRKVYFQYLKNLNEIEKTKESLNEIKLKKKEVESEIKQIKETIDKYKSLLKEKKCPYCERELKKDDFEEYENLLIGLNSKLLEITEVYTELEKLYESVKKKLDLMLAQNKKVDFQKIKNEIIRIRIKALEIEPIKILKKYANVKTKNEEKLVKEYEELKNLLEELESYKKSLKWQIEIIKTKKKDKEYKEMLERKESIEDLMKEIDKFKELLIKRNLAGELRWHALEQSSIKEIFRIFELGELEFDKDFNLYVNGIPIYACSGSQKVATVLAIKLALLGLYKVDFIILDEPTIYLDKKRIEDLKQMLLMIYEKKFVKQIILISHIESFIDIANHIIKVKKDKEYSEVKII